MTEKKFQSRKVYPVEGKDLTPKPVTPLPTDIVFRNGAISTKLTYVIRECHSNAKNYEAKNALILFIHMDGFDYLCYMHDGKPFDDYEDIWGNGLQPNQTTERGSAMQGCGLIASAGAMHRTPELLIGSFCKNKNFHAGRGYKSKLNLWFRDDISKSLAKKLQALIGPEAEKYRVFYLFRCTLKHIPSRVYLTVSMMSQLTMMAPSLTEGMTIYFAEKQVGHPSVQDKKYRCYTTAVKSGTHRKATNMHRRVASFKGFLDRFRYDNGHFEMKCKTFDVEVRPNLIHRYKAHIKVDVFPCRYIGPTDTWPVNERDGVDQGGGTFKKGGKNELGKPPTLKAFLVCPWVYTKMLQDVGAEDAERFGRFRDNSLGTYNRISTLMNILNCRYSEGRYFQPGGGISRPYVTIHVVIDSVEVIIDNSQEPPLEEQADPLAFLMDMQRRPDFTFDNEKGIHEIMREACKAVEEVPKELIQMCEELFPPRDGKFITLNLNREPRKVKRSSPVYDAYVHDGKGNVELLDGPKSVKDGSILWVTFVNKETGQPESNVTLCPMLSRGATLTNITNVADQIPGIEESQQKIEEIILMKGNGNG